MHCKVLWRRFLILDSILAWCITFLLLRSILSITRSSLQTPTWILHCTFAYQCECTINLCSVADLLQFFFSNNYHWSLIVIYVQQGCSVLLALTDLGCLPHFAIQVVFQRPGSYICIRNTKPISLLEMLNLASPNLSGVPGTQSWGCKLSYCYCYFVSLKTEKM